MTGGRIVDRRRFLALGATTLGGLAVLGATGELLAGCSAGGGGSSSGGAGAVDFQIAWLADFEYGGDFIADSKGYFRDNGVTVNFLTGGPSVDVEPLLVSGKALIGETAPQGTLQAITQGADLKIIGALYQKVAFAVISLASRPLAGPRDLIGKKIAVSTGQLVAWQTFLRINGIQQSQLDTVPRQADPTPLLDGEVDGWLGYVNDDVISIEASGHPTAHFLISDHGYTGLTHTYTVTTEALNDPKKRPLITAFLKADIHGWQDQVADPAAGATLAANVYGKSLKLNLAEQIKSAQATNQLCVSDTTKAHGLLWMSAEDIAATVHTLGLGGITGSADVFTNEILEEVYRGSNHV